MTQSDILKDYYTQNLKDKEVMADNIKKRIFKRKKMFFCRNFFIFKPLKKLEQ